MREDLQIIGKVLGFLTLFSNGKIEETDSIPLTDAERELLENFREKVNGMEDASSEFHIPEFRCQTESSLLECDPNILLKLLQKKIAPKVSATENCQAFFLHLNNCYQCFESYTTIMREYLKVLQQYEGK